jgi:hypothetical protein
MTPKPAGAPLTPRAGLRLAQTAAEVSVVTALGTTETTTTTIALRHATNISAPLASDTVTNQATILALCRPVLSAQTRA